METQRRQDARHVALTGPMRVYRKVQNGRLKGMDPPIRKNSGTRMSRIRWEIRQ